MADLDDGYDPDPEGKEEDFVLAKELKKRMKRPKPDGEFTAIQLAEDFGKTVKIGSDLLETVKGNVIKCGKKNADLSAWSAVDAPGIPPEVPRC